MATVRIEPTRCAYCGKVTTFLSVSNAQGETFCDAICQLADQYRYSPSFFVEHGYSSPGKKFVKSRVVEPDKEPNASTIKHLEGPRGSSTKS